MEVFPDNLVLDVCASQKLLLGLPGIEKLTQLHYFALHTQL